MDRPARSAPGGTHRRALCTPWWLAWVATAGAFAAGVSVCGAAGDVAEVSGGTLAAAWCGRCHAAPEPADLDRATWTRNVLPEMGARLGIYEFRGRRWRPDPTLPAGTYPAKPQLPLGDWAKIFDYYRDGAPAERLPAAPAPMRTTDRFEIRIPPARTDGEPAAVTAIVVDEQAGRVLIGDGAGRRVLVRDRALRPVAEVAVDTPPVHFAPLGNGSWLVTLIGSLVPGNVARGAVVRLDPPAPGGGDWRVTRLVRRLPRPVRALAADLDRDGLRDLIVAGFGHARGGISVHRGRPGGAYETVMLLAEPGAVSIALHQGDLYALMAQGDERLLRFPAAALTRSTGPERAAAPGSAPGASPGAAPVPATGSTPAPARARARAPDSGSSPARAAPEIVRRFPPQRGSSSMRVLDFDGDGAPDVLLTAGDNADFTPVFKRGHGVRLYLGDGRGGFRLALFHRLDGAYGAVAEDFDGDGDRDIAAVAWFADFSRGPDRAAGFVYLENRGSGTFRAARVPGLERLGRFAVIDAGDLDGDGAPDIVLGNLAYGAPGPSSPAPAAARAWAAGPRFVVLRTRPAGAPAQDP